MGEARLSSALQRRINEAIEEFLVRVKEKLEAGRCESTDEHRFSTDRNNDFFLSVKSVGISALASFPSVANHIRQHPIRARNSTAQLAIPNHARIDVMTLAIIRDQQSTFQRRLTRIV